MTTLYLVRHGEIDRRVGGADPPLSAQGCREAERVAAFLAACSISRIYASPLRRAQETALPTASVLDLPVHTDVRLRERINFGDLPGQSYQEFVAMWEHCNREREFVPPVGDSSCGAGARVEGFLTEIHAELSMGKVVAFAHGGLIADFLLNIATPTTLAQLSPAFVAQPYAGEVMRNGSITVVEYGGSEQGGYDVKAIAMTEHLAAI